MYAGFFKVEYLDEVEPTLMRERIINVGKLTEKELIELKDKFKYYEKHTLNTNR